MQTITTKYLGATTFHGARVKASHTAGAVTVTLPWDYALNADANHREAARALVEKLTWDGEWVGGCLNGAGNVYVLISGPAIDGFRVDAKKVVA